MTLSWNVEVPSWLVVAPSEDLVLPAAEYPADSMVDGRVKQRGIVAKR